MKFRGNKVWRTAKNKFQVLWLWLWLRVWNRSKVKLSRFDLFQFYISHTRIIISHFLLFLYVYYRNDNGFIYNRYNINNVWSTWLQMFEGSIRVETAKLFAFQAFGLSPEIEKSYRIKAVKLFCPITEIALMGFCNFHVLYFLYFLFMKWVMILGIHI